MNKYLRRFLWMMPVFTGILVFTGGGIYYMKAMSKVAGEGNYSPVDAFVLSLHDAAIASLLAVQISIVVGFAWWTFVLARTVFGKEARKARASRKAQQVATPSEETDAL